MCSDSDTLERLREALRRYITENFRTNGEPFDDDTALFSSGLIDSLGVIEFVTFIERQTGRSIRPTDITLENLDSIRRIVEMVREFEASNTQ